MTKIDPLHKFFMGFYVALLIIILFVLAITNSCERPVKYITNTTIDTVYTTDTVQTTTSGMELVADAAWRYDNDGNYGVYFFCALRNLTGGVIYNPQVTAYYYADADWDSLISAVSGPFYQTLDLADTSAKVMPEGRAYATLWSYPDPQILYWSFFVEWSNERGDMFQETFYPIEKY